jgi:GNAT superfamily N-acetyltransferase
VSLPAGYQARPATRDDLEAMVEVANAYDLADLGEPDTSVEHLEQGWHEEGFDERRDTLLARAADGTLAAFALLEPLPDGLLEAFGRVHPAHVGRGLGGGILKWTEARARERARQRGAAVRLHNGVTGSDGPASRLLRDRGYELVRFAWHMERSLLDPGIDQRVEAEGFVVRPASDDELADVWRTMAEAFRGHWEWRPLPFDEYRRHVQASALRAVLAVAEGEPAGAVTYRATARSGWIEELGVRPSWRRHGLGGSLLRWAFAELRDAGMTAARLNVDADNATGAVRLYERVGMHVRREWHVYEKAVSPDVS